MDEIMDYILFKFDNEGITRNQTYSKGRLQQTHGIQMLIYME